MDGADHHLEVLLPGAVVVVPAAMTARIVVPVAKDPTAVPVHEGVGMAEAVPGVPPLPERFRTDNVISPRGSFPDPGRYAPLWGSFS
jgi:hypothetical protein